MTISLFTPTNSTIYLRELYDSIKDQNFNEWVIILNGEATKEEVEYQRQFEYDRRIKIYKYEGQSNFIGALKKFATSKCTMEIIVEIDHDDLLTPNAIEEIKKAFEDKEVGFVYSNHADFKGNFEKGNRYDSAFGWGNRWRAFEYNGKILEECRAFESSPQSVSRIWYAPNHVRAWRKDVYDKIGGHDETMRVLDDQDLIARTYLATKMKHIDKCLYLYRIHGKNTWLERNQEIQNNVMRIYDKYIFDLMLRWCDLQGLRKLDLGGQFNHDKRLESIDLSEGIDLNKEWPFKDNSVGIIRANDLFEHLADKLHTIKEAYRVLAPGGMIIGQTPNALSQASYSDPTHYSHYVERSFKYYTEKRLAQYIGTPVRFQAIKLETTPLDQDGCSWIIHHLVALKGQECPGMILI